MEELLKEIDNELINLESSHDNINFVMKTYLTIKNKIENVELSLTSVKEQFESTKNKKKLKEIDSNMYNKNITYIKSEMEQFDKLSLDEQIEKYKKLSNKINMCKQYLESKKLTITNIQ